MRHRILIVSTLLLVQVTLAYAQQQRNKPIAEVPFVFNGYQVLIPVTINGGDDTLHFLFDSGCEVNILAFREAKILGLTSKDESGISGWSKGTLMIPKAGARVMQIGGMSIPYPQFYLQDLHDATMQGTKVDGVIGYDLLKRYAVALNFPQKKLSIYRSGSMHYPSGGELFKLGLNYKTPTLQAAVTLPDGNTLSSTYHLITGGHFGILFNEPYVKKYGLAIELKATGTITRPDLAGPVTYTECRVPYLLLHHFKMENIPALYSPKINDNAPDKEIAGAIGAEVWQHYTLIINLPQQELYLMKTP